MNRVLLTTYAVLGALICVWVGARVVARPGMMHILLDAPRPTPTPQTIPSSFLEAGRMACEGYVVNHRLWLAVRWCEMGRRTMEMGIQGRSAGIEAKHPYFPQAYWAAYIMAKRQREFSSSKALQLEYAKYRYPYIAYFCWRWNNRHWPKYYTDGKGSGVGTIYRKYSVAQLEAKIDKKVKEKWGTNW